VEVALCAQDHLFPLMCFPPYGAELTSLPVHHRSVISSPTFIESLHLQALPTCRPDISHTFLLACQNSIQ
jgi:hypothetical protein